MKWHSFSEVVTDATSKFKKIKASDYQSKGRYKIIDQGKEPIAGYTDDAKLVNGQLLPILIFGDHTRVLKYEDDPIALGADGAKALWVNPKLANARYVYYYLRSIQIKEAGYSRHFKFLKEVEIPIPFKDGAPDLNAQIRIALLLGKVDGLIAQRKQHLQQLDDLLKSVFLEMFGDPIINPRGFPIRRLSDLYINPKEGTKCGPFGSALKKEELVESGIPVWNMDNIGPAGQMALPFRMWITSDKYAELAAYSVQDGDIVISRAGTVGKMCVVRMQAQPAIISTNLIRLRLGPELRPLHFVSLMLYCKGRVGRLKTGPDGAFTHMNTGVLDSLEFPYPPIELQNQFANVVHKVEEIKSSYQQSLTGLEALYGTLSQKAFKGELDLSRVPLPADQA
jgi:type I restriction enzyme S subunit